MSETILNKPDFAGKVADLINRTRTAKEFDVRGLRPSTSKDSHDTPPVLTSDDLENILSMTQNDPSFDEIVKDVIDKFLTVETSELNEQHVEAPLLCDTKSVASSLFENMSVEEIPLKQRLRPRIPSRQSTEKKKKINIISNEIYTGIVPSAANLSSEFSSLTCHHSQPSLTEQQSTFVLSVPVLIQNCSEVIPIIKNVPSITESMKITTTIVDNLPVDAETNNVVDNTLELNIGAMSSFNVQEIPSFTQLNPGQPVKESTPKVPVNENYLNSKSKSTPSRKASHVRILNFNQTPSLRHRNRLRLPAIKEFSSPANSSIKISTPGSAPATINSSKVQTKCDVDESNTTEPLNKNGNVRSNEEHFSENSNSISNTPKVAKNRRRRQIAEDSKRNEKLQKKMETSKLFTLDDWNQLRKQSKCLQIDQQLRMINEQAEIKVRSRRRRAPKKNIPKETVADKQQQPSGDGQKDKENSSTKKAPINATSGEAADSNHSQLEPNVRPPNVMKFKIASPRKNATFRKALRKSKAAIQQTLKTETSKSTSDDRKSIWNKEQVTTELNRSDTVQEVATMLTNLSETILAETSKKTDCVSEDSEIVLETPIKLDLETPSKFEHSLTPLPNTPRFAIPIVSLSHETPVPKIFASISTISVVKNCDDILTPSFAITPGFKETPAKSGNEASPAAASGYSSRRTDYSSCSSYYRPDESEEINQNLETFLNQRRRERQSQSESDGGCVHLQKETQSITGSTKKIECPGVPMERVKSSTDDQTKIPKPHYTMMDEECLLSESVITTASYCSSSSSSFTCSTCSTDSSDENTMDRLQKVSQLEEKDVEWHFDEQKIEGATASNNSLVDEKTGEVRFPLRNWITPKKVEISPEKCETIAVDVHVARERQRLEMEETKKRTLKIIRMESAAASAKCVPKIKKSNLKTYKLPEDMPKPIPQSRKDRILQNSIIERARPTPLKLIPSTSNRRKNATPRKTIFIGDLPKAATPDRKSASKRKIDSYKKIPIIPEGPLSLITSASFNSSSEVEKSANTFVAKSLSSPTLKNELRKSMPEEVLSDSDKESDGESSDNEEEFEIINNCEENKTNFFFFKESDDFQQRTSIVSTTHVLPPPPMILRLEDQSVTINTDQAMDIFTMEPQQIDEK